MSKRTQSRSKSSSGNEKRNQLIALLVAAVLYFLTVCFTSASTGTVTGFVLALAAIVVGIAAFSKLRDLVCLPLVILAAFVLMDGVSTMYSVSGKFALSEFLKVLSSFSLMLILLGIAPGKGTRPARWIAKVLSGYAAIAGFLSIDMLSTRLISGPVLQFLNNFSSDFAGLGGVEAGVRMTSIFENPNIFAGVAGLGVLLSLGLVCTAESKNERTCQTVVLYVSALAFLLAFSMGATASILAAFLVLLILEQADRRSSLLVLMVETLVFTLISAFLVSLTSFQVWSGIQPVPLLCVVVGAALLAVSDRFLGQKLADILAGKAKLVPILIVVVLVVLAGYMLAAFNLTGSISLAAGEGVRRAAYPDPGTYTLSVESSGDINVTIESQNQQETMMHTSTILFNGSAAGASFTVPEDSMVVYFNFNAPAGADFQSALFDGSAGSGTIPLGYKLLPGFIANRLQGLWANENAIQRFVFFEDGMKLVKRSPIIGLGMGVYENSIRNVQTFFYETKYAHNHYIQVLAETGIIGEVLWIGLLAGSAVAILLDRKKGAEAHPLTPALGAALVFMAAHAATEVVFSAFPYLPIAIGTFGLIILCCGKSIPKPEFNRKARGGILIAVLVLLGVYDCLITTNLVAEMLVGDTPTLNSLDRAAEVDQFEWADYALSYVVNSVNAEDSDGAIRAKADKWAEKLAKVDSNTIPYYLASYYFQTGRQADAFAMVDQYTAYCSSDPSCWQESFELMLSFYEASESYRQGFLQIAQNLEDWNAANMGSITVSEEVQNMITALRTIENTPD